MEKAGAAICLLLALLAVTSAEQSSLRGMVGSAQRGESGAGGDSGASGDTGDGIEEELNQEEKYATVDQKGQEHQKNLKELNDATKAHAKATLNVKIQTFKKGVRSDLAGDMVQNVLTANKNAEEALVKVVDSKKALDEAKRDAGMALGNTGGKNGIKKQLCRARIVSKEKDARRMESRLHMQQAKARAAGEFFVAKLRKAHEAAKLVSAQNSQHSKKFRLEVSLNATLSANEARQDSVKARANVDELASHAEDARMDARRVADECAAVLGPVSRLEQDPDAQDPDLKGLSKDDGKPEEEHPSMEDSMRAQQKAAVASLNKAMGTPGVKGMTEAGKWMQQQQ